MINKKKPWIKARWIGVALLLFATGYLTLNYRILVVGVLYRWAAHDQFNAIWNLVSYASQGLLLFLVIGSISGWAFRSVLLLVFISGTVNLVYQSILYDLINLSTFQWMLAESRQSLSALKEFYKDFIWGVTRAGIAVGLFTLTRKAIKYAVFSKMAPHPENAPILTIVVLMIFLAADPALKALGRDRGAEMNVYGMAYQTMTEEVPNRMPASVKPDFKPSANKIIWLIDESISWRYYDEMFRSEWVSRWGGIDFGEARSLGNCSAQSNAALRWGVNVSKLNASTDLRTNSTVWAYAKQAGFRTILMDGQVHGNPQNYLWPPEKRLIDEVVPMAAGLDSDLKIARRLNGLLKADGRHFAYIVLKGAHYQYFSNYPDGNLDRSLPIEEQYRKALRYSKGNFLNELLDGVNMRNVVIFYTSDHGQHLGNGVIPHCNNKPHPEELSVPLILFTDPDLRNQFQRNDGEIRSHSQIFPTTLLLMGYAAEYASREYDNPLPTTSKRIVRFGKRIFPSTNADSIEFFFDDSN